MTGIMKQSDKVTTYVTEYIVDKDDDIKTLPTGCAPGSIALVAETSNVYILNNKREWKPL